MFREFLFVIFVFWVIVGVVHESSYKTSWLALVEGDDGEVKLLFWILLVLCTYLVEFENMNHRAFREINIGLWSL